MIIYFKKFADVVTVIRERRPTREELKENPEVLVVEESVTVRFQKAGRDPEISQKKQMRKAR